MNKEEFSSYFDLTAYLAFLKLEGEDSFQFLNNLTTNDISHLSNFQGQSNLILDRQAKIKFIFWNYRVDDSLLLLTRKENAESLTAFLNENVFLEKLTISPLSDFTPIATFKESNLKKLLADDNEELTKIKTDCLLKREDHFIIKTDFTFHNDFIVVTKKNNLEKISLLKKETDFFDSLVFEKSKWAFIDNLVDSPSVLETHFYQLAVNFTKGCYTGQEVIAKFHSRKGRAVKKLVMLSLAREETIAEVRKENLQYDEKKILTIFKIKNSPTFKKIFILALINANYSPELKEIFLNGRRKEISISLLPMKKTTEFEKHYNLGLEFFHEGNIAQAKINFKKAISLKKDDEAALEALSLCEEKLKNFPKAIEINQAIAKANPSAIMPHTNLSRLYMLSGLIMEAEEENKKATVLMFKQSAKATPSLKAARPRKNRQIDFYKNILKEEPNDDIAHFQLGKIYHEQEQYETARKHFEKTIAINEQYSLAYYYLGNIFFKLGNKNLASNFLKQGIVVAKKNGDFAPLKKIETQLQEVNSKMP